MSIEITKNKERHLIIVDLDGTLLNKDFSTLNQKNKKVLQELQKRGDKICIATGRNYLSALPFYKEIGLDTFLITYNGAYINHPLKNETPSITIPISNQVIRGILDEDIIKENLLNVMVDSTDKQSISSSNDIYYQEIFFNNNPYVVIDTVASVPVPVNSHTFQINTKKNGILYYDINKHKQGEVEIQKLKENIGTGGKIVECAFFIESKSKEGWPQIEKIIELKEGGNTNILRFLQQSGNKDCLQLVLEFPNETNLVDNVIRRLRKNYKSSITFYCGEKLKAEREGKKVLVPDHTKQIIKIRNYNANKGEAAKLVAGYYNISLNRTIAFGNDINDIEMMNRVGIGVAVSNSANNLKAYVHDITEFDSHSGGVAKYLADYFGITPES